MGGEGASQSDCGAYGGDMHVACLLCSEAVLGSVCRCLDQRHNFVARLSHDVTLVLHFARICVERVAVMDHVRNS